jgi:hypothetical protein
VACVAIAVSVESSFSHNQILIWNQFSLQHNTQPTGGLMTKHILLAGILGGIAMFVWASLAHMVLPLGQTGIKEIPNEASVLSAMHSNLGEKSGLYMFPGMELGANPTREQQHAAMEHYGEKLAANPSGLLVYHPPGAKALTPGQLATEFLTEVVEALMVVFLLAQTRLTSFGPRVGFVTLAGVLAAITTNISYWNWYGFPGSYTTAYMTIETIGYLVAGIVAALIMKSSAPKTLVTAA